MSSAAHIQLWYQRGQIEYVNYYMALYAAFNAWYREQTNTTNDRQALNHLRRGNQLWQAYCRGECMQDLTLYMNQLVEYTQREPLSHATPHWVGEVDHVHDWESLVEYWYRVRCLVMHGAEIHASYVYLAYETLNIFMGEIVQRARY